MINLGKPSFDQQEIDVVSEVIKSGWVGRGPNVEAFEKEFAAHQGAKFGVAMNGCTFGLFLSLRYRKIGPGDEVIVPSMTWNATAAVVFQSGATPVFADVIPGTWCLDPEDVKRKITDKTKLVIAVHYAAQFAKGFENFPVPVLYDSAHRVEEGGFPGISSVHSFYVTKNFCSVRGGMVLTNDPDEAAWIKMCVGSGNKTEVLKRYTSGAFHYEIEYPSWNFDMTDIEGAIARVQLKKLPGFMKRREEVLQKYNEAFGLHNTGNHLYPILVENRDEFLSKMREKGVQCGIHYLPLHLMKGYKHLTAGSLPVTEYFGAHMVSLPFFPGLSDQDVQTVIDAVLSTEKPIQSYQGVTL